MLLTSGGLSTDKIKEQFLEMVGKDPEDSSVAFINNAADLDPNPWYVRSDVKQLEDLKFKVQEIDLKEYSQQSLYDLLSTFDVIWVSGGNTFYLLYWVRKSGFNKVIKQLLDEGTVYVGVSAGSIIMGNTIETSGWKGWDDPTVVDLENFDGLKLVDLSIFAHYDSQYEKLVEENRHKVPGKLVCLQDDQALVVNPQVKLI